MARILVTEPIADGGLDRLRDAGHEVDVQLGLSPEQLLDGDPGRPRAHHPLRHRRSPPRSSPPAPTSSWSAGPASASTTSTSPPPPTAASWSSTPRSPTSSRPPSTPWRCCWPRPATCPRPHAALEGRAAGSARKWDGRRARRQDPRRHRPRPHRQARGPAGPGLRHEARRLRPVRLRREGPPDERRAASTSTTLLAESDFVTIHVAKTPETIGLIDAELPGQGQAGHPHHQRGPRRHRRRGRPGRGHPRAATSAAPPSTCSPRSPPPSRRCSTSPRSWSPRTSGPAPTRPRTRPATPSPSMVGLALAGEFVPFAVNVSAAEAIETVRPFLPLAERLGALFAGLAGARRRSLEIEYQGQIADYDTRILTLSLLKGFFGRDQRRAGVVRERPADGRGAGHRGPRDHDDHVARLREPHHRPRRRPRPGRHARRASTARPASSWSTTTASTCRRPTTCSWSATTTAPA